MQASAELARQEACLEFVQRYRDAQRGEEGGGAAAPLPVLTSECPGFVLFVEKTHGEQLLPHLSTVRSVQAVSGSLLKGPAAPELLGDVGAGRVEGGGDEAQEVLGAPGGCQGTSSATEVREEMGTREHRGGEGKQVWHCAVMSCPDKKLEAAREELSDGSGGPDMQVLCTRAKGRRGSVSCVALASSRL